MGDFIEQAGPDAVRDVLVGRAPVGFDRKPDGELSLALEGGHSLHRIIHAADATGKSIEVALIRALESHPCVTLLTGHTAVDLLTPGHHGLDRLAVYRRQSCAARICWSRPAER